MPELRCTVQTCMHNKEQYCDLDAITVGGSKAKKAADTCCDSFKERKDNSYSNSSKEASPNSEIDCMATKCKYNDQCKCQAGCICVEGRSASYADDTRCGTFAKAQRKNSIKQGKKRTSDPENHVSKNEQDSGNRSFFI